MTSPPPPSFVDLFGVRPAISSSAPGRVNLIGEHTDYNGGLVLPAAIPQRTTVEMAARDDDAVHAWSANIGGSGERRAYTIGREARGGAWIDYVQGVTQVLSAAGHHLRGVSLRIASAVPAGSGLSSSAALEMSILRGLRDLFSIPLDDVQLAVLGQRAENEFVGAPVGIMDQMACMLADEAHALFLDTRSLAYERVPIPGAAELVVINSGVTHSHAGGDYRTRRAECDRAAALLGVDQLREVTDCRPAAALPPPLDRRVRHVVTENARVEEAVRALRARDLRTVGELFAASHRSMRDDFEVSTAEIDLLVTLAAAHDAVFGARLTGGGFGGSIVAIARRGTGRAAAEAVAAEYARRTGRTATVLVPVPPAT